MVTLEEGSESLTGMYKMVYGSFKTFEQLEYERKYKQFNREMKEILAEPASGGRIFEEKTTKET